MFYCLISTRKYLFKSGGKLVMITLCALLLGITDFPNDESVWGPCHCGCPTTVIKGTHEAQTDS